MSEDMLTTRPFAAGQLNFEVRTAAPEDRDLIETLFFDLPRPGPDVELAMFEVLREHHAGETSWRMSGPRIDGPSSSSEAAVLVRLVSAVNLAALDADPTALHLHAGAVARDGQVILIAAERNTGKTTTVAHLVARGWAFLTDETVRISNRAEQVQGFSKPLSLKPGGWRLVDHLRPYLLPPIVDDTAGESFRFVPIGRSGAEVETDGVPRLVVLLRRPADGTDDGALPVVRELHAADAVVALMQETLDAERFGDAAVELAALAASCRCVEVVIGSPEATAARIEELFENGPVSPSSWQVLPPSPEIAPGVVSVALGDRTVVHDTTTGRILALDPAGTRVWEQVGGWQVHSDIDVSGPVIAGFVAQLGALGLLGSGEGSDVAR